MPEFRLNIGSTADAIRFSELDAFTRGYIEAMFFTDASNPDDGDLENAAFADLAPETLADIVAECDRFQKENADTLAAAYAHPKGYTEEQAGRDFWFTRNGHGVGFWDRDLGDIGDTLSKRCGWRTSFPERALYLGDDSRVYVCSA